MRSDGWLVLLTAKGHTTPPPGTATPLPARRYVAEELGVDGVTFTDDTSAEHVVLLLSFDPRMVGRAVPRERVEAIAEEAADLLVHEPCYRGLAGPWHVEAAGWRRHDKWGDGAKYAAVSRA